MRRLVRPALVGASALLAMASAMSAGSAVFVSGQLIKPPRGPSQLPVELLAGEGPGRLRLRAAPAASRRQRGVSGASSSMTLSEPGRWGVAYPGGYVQLGEPLKLADGTVSRPVLATFGAPPALRPEGGTGSDAGSEAGSEAGSDTGVRGLFERVAFPSDPDLVATVFPELEVVAVPSPRGALPLWALRYGTGPSSRLRDRVRLSGPSRPAGLRRPSTRSLDASKRPVVVGAHGRGVSPAEMLRLADACRREGLDLYAASYHNDPHVAGTGEELMSLGMRESEDLWVQVAAAAERSGASSVVLAGISLGGASVANLLVRFAVRDGERLLLPFPAASPSDGPGASPSGRLQLAPDPDRAPLHVVGVVLEAPALHWPRIVAQVASTLRMPRLLVGPVMLSARVRAGLDRPAISPLRALGRAALMSTPALIIHGEEDSVVPVSVSDELAALWPAAGYLRLEQVGHARAFNQEHDRYQRAVSEFLSSALQLPDPAGGRLRPLPWLRRRALLRP